MQKSQPTASLKTCSNLKENESKKFQLPGSIAGRRAVYDFIVANPGSGLTDVKGLSVVSVTKIASNPIADETNYADLVALAAHDLDSPLRKLSMLLDRITTKYAAVADKDTQDFVKRANSSLVDMRTMIDNLSVLANVTRAVMKKSACDLASIVEDVIKSIKAQAGEEKILLSATNLPVIEGDIYQYRLLFNHLLGNAFKFRKKQIALQLSISSEEVPEDEKKLQGLVETKPYVKITIVDNGIGFDVEDAQKIFQPFVRLNGKSEYPGNGIGLAISRKIVENHCGILYAQSEENFGARFIVLLPISPY